MSRSEQLRIFEPRLKELWGQLNNYVETESEADYALILVQFQAAEDAMSGIRMTTETQNLYECIDELRNNLKAHHEHGNWHSINQALDNLREAFELIQALRE